MLNMLCYPQASLSACHFSDYKDSDNMPVTLKIKPTNAYGNI
jgi:hypothetical protein